MGPLSFGLTGSSSSARSGGDDEKSFGKVLLVRIDRGAILIQYFEIPRDDDIVPLELCTILNLIYNNMLSQTMTPRLETSSKRLA